MFRCPRRPWMNFVVGLVAALVPGTLHAQTGRIVPLAAAIQQAAAGATPVRRLSVDDAVKLALEQNLGIQIQRLDPQIQDVGVAQARSFWAPNLSGNLAGNSQVQAVTSALSGGANSIDNGTFSSGVGLNQVLPWGAAYSTNWGSSRYTTNNLFSSFSPQLQSNVTLSYTQRLLRGLRTDQIREQVELSSKLRDLSNIQLVTVVAQTVRNVKNAYWDLSYAINNLAAQRQSLELAQRSLRDNQRRVEIGTMAPIDIIQAQAEVASNEQGAILAEAAIRRAEDQLRALIFDPDAPDFWTTTLEPSDRAPFEERTIDLQAAIRNALDKRTDLAQGNNSLSRSNVEIRYYEDQRLPDIQASVSYVSTGTGGSELSPVDFTRIIGGGAIPPRNVISGRSYGSVLGDVAGGSYPNWTVGVSVAYPLGSSTAQTNLARARLQYQQAQTQMKSLRLQIVTQVREAARQVTTNEQRVRSARASRELQERKLDAEEKKQAAGMSTTFLVFQAQRDLSQARTQEIQAISDYNKSLVDFEAVQEVPLTAGTVQLTNAAQGAIETGGNLIIRQ